MTTRFPFLCRTWRKFGFHANCHIFGLVLPPSAEGLHPAPASRSLLLLFFQKKTYPDMTIKMVKARIGAKITMRVVLPFAVGTGFHPGGKESRMSSLLSVGVGLGYPLVEAACVDVQSED